MSHAATKVRLEDLDIKPYVITKLKMAGIQSVFDLAISIPHQLVDIDGGMLTLMNTLHLNLLLKPWSILDCSTRISLQLRIF